MAQIFYVSNSDLCASDSYKKEQNDISHPWKTLARVSRESFLAGDKILLRCGDRWTNEKLEPKGDGNPADPSDEADTGWITLGSYGDLKLGKPCISNPPEDYSLIFAINGLRTYAKPAIIIQNYGGWQVKGLEICNAEHGIVVDGTGVPENSILKGFRIEDCNIHDIYGYPVIKDGGNFTITRSEAIVFIPNHRNKHSEEFHHVLIRNCIIENIGGALQFGSFHDFTVDGVYIDNNVEDSRPEYHNTEGLRNWLGGGRNLKIINSTFLRCGYPSGVEHGAAAICLASVANGSVENCEIAYTTDPMTNDGVAIDYCGNMHDFYTSRCYIHDNDGSAFLFDQQGIPNTNAGVIDCCLIDNGLDGLDGVEQWCEGSPECCPLPPAFLRVFLGETGNLAGNLIRRSYEDQPLYQTWDIYNPDHFENSEQFPAFTYEIRNIDSPKIFLRYNTSGNTVISSGTVPHLEPGIYNDTDFRIKYTGTWNKRVDTDLYMGSQKESVTGGDYFEFGFKGTRARVYGNVGDRRQLIYDSGLLDSGIHNVRIEVVEAKGDELVNSLVPCDMIEIT